MTLLHAKAQLEKLQSELNFSGNEMAEWLRDEKETGEDIAKVAALMADVAGSLQICVTTFLEQWDFAEDCRRAEAKEAAEAGADA